MIARAELLVHRATPVGVGGVAIVELLGSRAGATLARHFRARRGTLPPRGRAGFGVLVGSEREAVDDVIVSRFSGPESWCGLPGWTISCHGGPAVTDRVIRVFTAAGGRLVTSGEILDLAVESGAMDRVRQQAFDLLTAARTERAAHYFLRQYNGEFGRRLLGLLGRVEHERSAVLAELGLWLVEAPAALRLGKPLRVLLAGRANVGKSTLFNALLGEERVVVWHDPGTTRDLIAETIDVAGYPVVIIDGAGSRPDEMTGPVEREGIRRALGAPRDAVLFLVARAGSGAAIELPEELSGDRVIVVWTKQDLVSAEKGENSTESIAAAAADAVSSRQSVEVSGVTGHGLDRLRDRMRAAWLGPPEALAVPALPFTDDLMSRTESLKESWSRATSGFRELLDASFPGLRP